MTRRGYSGALLRYRIVAYVTGVLINVLFFIGLPLKYLADSPGVVSVVGFLHGMAFIVYCITIIDLGARCRWPVVRMGLVMLAGVVPVMTFVAEHRVVVRVGDGSWAPPSPRPEELVKG